MWLDDGLVQAENTAINPKAQARSILKRGYLRFKCREKAVRERDPGHEPIDRVQER